MTIRKEHASQLHVDYGTRKEEFIDEAFTVADYDQFVDRCTERAKVIFDRPFDRVISSWMPQEGVRLFDGIVWDSAFFDGPHSFSIVVGVNEFGRVSLYSLNGHFGYNKFDVNQATANKAFELAKSAIETWVEAE